MGKHVLRTEAQIAEFNEKYIPKGYIWKPVPEGENPYDPTYPLGPNDYPIHTSFFKEAGLRLPLWPLLVDFLRCTKLVLTQLSPNVVRIIGGIEALNRIHGTDLGLDELKFCYSLSRSNQGVYSINARSDAPSLVFGLPDSHKGNDADMIIIVGNVEPDPINKPIPKRHRGPGLH